MGDFEGRRGKSSAMKAVAGLLKRNSLILSSLLLVLFVLIVWAAWAAYGAPLAVKEFCGFETDCEFLGKLGQVGDIFGGINALFAALAFVAVSVSTYQASRTYHRDRQMEQDAIFVNQIKTTYEWAYSVFSKDLEYSYANKERWLKTARHLLRAKGISDRVETEVYRLILAEQEEFWRRKFEEALAGLAQDYKMLPASYFGNFVRDSDFPDLLIRESRVNETSVKVVVDFSWTKWQPNDPIDLAEKNGDLKNWSRGPVGKGLERHIFMMNESRKKRKIREDSVQK